MNSNVRRISTIVFSVTGVMLALPVSVSAQVADAISREYRHRLVVADADSSTSQDRYLAAEAARFMRRFDEAEHYLRTAQVAARDESDHNGILVQRLWLELATGGGIAGVQRVFAEERRRKEMLPTVLAGWVNSFPELLVGGEFDATLDSLRGDAEDPLYRCDCYAPKAWMHRVAGRMDVSRIYWDSLLISWQRVPDFATPFNEADWLAQRARNHARAGHFEEARAQLNRAAEVDVTAFESVFIRRRRAQAYAELGDIENLIADLDYLLSVPSPVTTHTLQARLTWSAVRDHPEFRALMAKHRGM